jgi:hypothetical protein
VLAFGTIGAIFYALFGYVTVFATVATEPVFGKIDIAAFYEDGFAFDEGFGDGFAGFVVDAGKGGAGYLHDYSGFFLAEVFVVGKAK